MPAVVCDVTRADFASITVARPWQTDSTSASLAEVQSRCEMKGFGGIKLSP
jgi:hypothetical protein